MEPAGLSHRDARRRWAELIRLIYEVDSLVCPKCGGTTRVIALIQEPKVFDKILKHLRAQGPQRGAARVLGAWCVADVRGGAGC